MNKQFADKMIEKYQKIFYGFSISKSYSIEEAEELSSRIVLEAYVMLLKVDDIDNWDGYMYRIAQNVYARYIMEKKKHEFFSIENMELSVENSFVEELVRSEEFQLLKREIAWLSNQQRQIMYLFYFENHKISEISVKLNIPEGTVKWHLFDAKKMVKEGINLMRNSGELGINPIMFHSMGHNGIPGNMGDTKNFLNSRLRQNIAYAAYYEAKTIQEIAKELGVSPVYVEDEVLFLEEYGFLDKLKGNKYLTNIFITDLTQDVYKQIHEVEKEIAEIICNEYVPILIDSYKNYNSSDIYVPDNDSGFLMWEIVMVALAWMNWEKAFCNNELLDGTHYRVKRKDGGDYIAHASINNEEMFDVENESSELHYRVCGDMNRDTSLYPIASWQLSTEFDSREFGWEDNKCSDYEALYLFINGKLEKSEATLEKYKRLYDRGLIYHKNGKDEVNVVVVKLNKQIPQNSSDNIFLSNIPEYPEDMIKKIKEKQFKIWEIQKEHYPKHMHKLLRYYCNNYNNRVMVLDELLKRKILSPLNESQQKGVMTIVYSDEIPYNK